MPTGPPGSAISPEVMPMLHFPGLMIPGQFGPRRRVPGNSSIRRLYARHSSWAGMPSVMHTMNSIPASAASMMASAAPLGGTLMNDAVAPVSFTTSATDAYTGMPSISSPPRLGLVPPTTLVPYALLRRPWKRPWLVGLMPWITTLVVSSTKMLTFVPVLSGRSLRSGLGQGDDAAGGIEHGRLGDQRVRQVVGQQL